MNKALLSSKKHNWRTPDEVLDLVRQIGPITLDPYASTNPRHWFADMNWTIDNWIDEIGFPRQVFYHSKYPGVAFQNPPYGSFIKAAVNRYRDLQYTEHTIILIPGRPGSQWFKILFNHSNAFCFWDGRITFVGASGPAPFPSAFFYRGINPTRFVEVFKSKGIARYL